MSTQTKETERLDARVAGRVQGVGFRQFVVRQAQRLGLTGWVRNEPDGAVRLVAEGPRETLETLLQAVHQGPPGSRVDSVSPYWMAGSGEFEGFSVQYF